jgi:hypothetical protein
MPAGLATKYCFAFGHLQLIPYGLSWQCGGNYHGRERDSSRISRWPYNRLHMAGWQKSGLKFGVKAQ